MISVERVYFSGDKFFQDVLESMEQARSSIIIELYIFYLDQLGQKILEKLKKIAQQKSIEITIMVDAIGSKDVWQNELIDQLSKQGIKITQFNDLLQKNCVQKLELNPTKIPFKFVRFLNRINRRNHRKVFLIDNKKLFTGGFNIADYHVKEFCSNPRKDMGVFLERENFDSISISHESALDCGGLTERLPTKA